MTPELSCQCSYALFLSQTHNNSFKFRDGKSTKIEVSLNMSLVQKKKLKIPQVEEVPRGSISLCLHGK